MYSSFIRSTAWLGLDSGAIPVQMLVCPFAMTPKALPLPACQGSCTIWQCFAAAGKLLHASLRQSSFSHKHFEMRHAAQCENVESTSHTWPDIRKAPALCSVPECINASGWLALCPSQPCDPVACDPATSWETSMWPLWGALQDCFCPCNMLRDTGCCLHNSTQQMLEH